MALCGYVTTKDYGNYIILLKNPLRLAVTPSILMFDCMGPDHIREWIGAYALDMRSVGELNTVSVTKHLCNLFV